MRKADRERIAEARQHHWKYWNELSQVERCYSTLAYHEEQDFHVLLKKLDDLLDFMETCPIVNQYCLKRIRLVKERVEKTHRLIYADIEERERHLAGMIASRKGRNRKLAVKRTGKPLPIEGRAFRNRQRRRDKLKENDWDKIAESTAAWVTDGREGGNYFPYNVFVYGDLHSDLDYVYFGALHYIFDPQKDSGECSDAEADWDTWQYIYNELASIGSDLDELLLHKLEVHGREHMTRLAKWRDTKEARYYLSHRGDPDAAERFANGLPWKEVRDKFRAKLVRRVKDEVKKFTLVLARDAVA